MRRLAYLLAIAVGTSIASGAYASSETSGERYAEPYPHKPDQDTGTPRLGPSGDYIPGPGGALKPPAKRAKTSNGVQGPQPQPYR